MAGFDNDIIVGTGLDLSGSFPHQNRLNVDGALYIGNASGNPQAAVPTSSDDTLDIVAGPGTLDFKLGTGISGDFLQVANNLSDVPNDALARSNLGLSSMAIQSAAAVAITGGTITGITDLAVADGGTGASDASGARTNLGLGTIATQNSNNVTITGGSITGITDLAVADGGTGRSDATAYAVICGGTTATGAHQSIAGVGTSGQVLTSNGAGALPTFQAAGGGGDYTLISTATASSSASISFTDLSSTYHKYVIDISNLQPVTDDVLMQIRTSTNNGSSYDSGASDYGWVVLVNEFISTSALTDTGDDADTRIGTFLPSGNLMGNAANEISSYTIELMNPSAATYFQLYFHGVVTNMDGLRYNVSGAGSRLTAADVDAIQFTMSTGNISTGTFKLYGISAS